MTFYYCAECGCLSGQGQLASRHYLLTAGDHKPFTAFGNVSHRRPRTVSLDCLCLLSAPGRQTDRLAG